MSHKCEETIVCKKITNMSMSVCKKDLVLESGTPVILPLYPGDCNPPKDNAVDSTSSAASTSSASSKNENSQEKLKQDSLVLLPSNNTSNFKNFSITPVLHIGDELFNNTGSASINAEDKIGLLDRKDPVVHHESIPWQPIDFPDSSNTNSLDGTQNKRENARSFNSFLTNVVLRNSSTNFTIKTPNILQSNYSETTISSEKPEIKEPVLSTAALRSSLWSRQVSLSHPDDTSKTSSTDSNEKPEITEPVLNPKKPTENNISETGTPRPSILKPREISRESLGKLSLDEDAKWIPAQELNPPPLGGTQTWQHWMTETTTSNNVTPVTDKPKLDEQKYTSSNTTEGQSRRLIPTKIMKKSHTSPTMIQFFPQRLAALLAQAEYYARLTLSFPISAMNKLIGKSTSVKPTENDQETSASTNKLYTLSQQTYSENAQQINSNFETQRKPKQFTTVKPLTEEQSIKVNKSSKISGFQPRMDVIGNFPQINKLIQKDNVYVPYTYSNVESDDKDTTEISRFIPLSQYSQTNNVNYNYTIEEDNNSSGDTNKNSSKPLPNTQVDKFNGSKENDTNFTSFYTNILRHIYPRFPER